MNTSALIAQHLIDVHEGGNWTEVNVIETLKDVTLAEANTVTAASANTIATLVNHLMFWNKAMMARLQDIDMDIPDSNGYDDPQLQTEADWQRLKEEHMTSAHEFADTIRSITEERLHQPIVPGRSSIYKNVQGSVEHIHYHLGQIVILKKLIRNLQN